METVGWYQNPCKFAMTDPLLSKLLGTVGTFGLQFYIYFINKVTISWTGKECQTDYDFFWWNEKSQFV